MRRIGSTTRRRRALRRKTPFKDGLNWYSYVANNPLMFMDPWGLAEYQVGGLDLAPQFVHDAGFVYDPNAKITPNDYATWLAWGFGPPTGHLLIGSDAARMYEHYRSGWGLPMKVDYTRAYNEDPVIKNAIDNEISIMKDFATSTYANDEETPFEIIGGLQGIRNGDSQNWQKTIGAHYVYGHGLITVSTKTGMATMVVTFYMEDMYNFNPGASDIVTKIEDAVNGRFAELGWAQEFITYGTLTQTIRWKIAQAQQIVCKPYKDGSGV